MYSLAHAARFALLLLSVMPVRSHAQPPRPDAAAIASAVDSLARHAIALGAGPALGVAIVMDGRTILSRSYGLADASAGVSADDRTLWYIASTSKSITGVALALLADEGRVSLNAPIATLLPNARWHAESDPTSISLADFLGHTSGLRGGAVVAQSSSFGQIQERDWPTLLEWSGPLPNRDLAYSNLGYLVGAMVIDRVQPEGWRSFSERRLFRPAGMHETFARVSGLDTRRFAMPHLRQRDGSLETATFAKVDGTMNGAGGHLATMSDLARWLIVNMDSGRIDGRQVLPASAVALAQTQLRPHPRGDAVRFRFFERLGWGWGWDLGRYDDEPMVSRFGAYHSFRSHLSFLPQRRIGVAVQANGEDGNALTDIIAAFAYDLHSGRDDARERTRARLEAYLVTRESERTSLATSDSERAARQTQPLSRGWDAYTGVFAHPGYGTVSFSRSGPSLRFRWGAVSGPVEIHEAAQDWLRMSALGNDWHPRFTFDASGRATSVRLYGVEFSRVATVR